MLFLKMRPAVGTVNSTISGAATFPFRVRAEIRAAGRVDLSLSLRVLPHEKSNDILRGSRNGRLGGWKGG